MYTEEKNDGGKDENKMANIQENACIGINLCLNPRGTKSP